MFVSAGVECVSRYAKGAADYLPDTLNPRYRAALDRTAERSGAEPMERLVRQLVSGSEVRFRLEAVRTILLNSVSHARRLSGTLNESAAVCRTVCRTDARKPWRKCGGCMNRSQEPRDHAAASALRLPTAKK